MDKNTVKECLIELKNKYSPEPGGEISERRIKGLLRTIRKYSRKKLRGASEDMSAQDICLCDNYYLIEQETRKIIKDERPQKRTVFFAEELLELTGCVIDAPTVSAFFEVLCRDDYLDDDEVVSAAGSFRYALIKSICDYCRGGGLSVEVSVSSLRRLEEIDFAQFVNGFSPIERLLRSDPSGVYPLMDKATQHSYKSRVARLAKQQKAEKKQICEQILKKSSEDGGRHIGFYLFDGAPGGRAYLAVLAISFLLIYSIFIALLAAVSNNPRSIAAIPLGLFCCGHIAKKLTDFAAPSVYPTVTLPRLKLDSVPDNMRTAVVITALVTDAVSVKALTERLKDFYLKNKSSGNISYGLIVDFKESKTETESKDKAITEAVKGETDSLNAIYGGGFFALLRKRRFCADDGVWRGWERKRGAVLDFAAFLRGRGSGDLEFTGDKAAVADIVYAVTLDSDTELRLMQVPRLVGIMAHPLNRPYAECIDGVWQVTRGSAIMQPLMATALKDSAITPFCMLQSGAGGNDSYSSASFDSYQCAFGNGLYCGKGIFEVDTFLKVLEGAFPENRVLSHDIIEGARLSSALINDEYFSDSMPSQPTAWFKRAHRWVRGDTQALPFALPTVRDAAGERHANPIKKVYVLALWDNVFRALFPIFAAALIFVSRFCMRQAAACITGLVLLSLAADLILNAVRMTVKRGFQPLKRNFFARVTASIWNSFLRFAFELSALFFTAWNNADAMVRSIWRMKVSGKKLLEWSTADQLSGKTTGTLGYVLYMLPSLIGGAALLLISRYGVCRLIGIMWLIFPFVCRIMSLPFAQQRPLGRKEKQRILGYAADSFKYFDALVTAEENYLPPDNYAVSPNEAVASRSSPTNIGLYLLSLLAARDMRLIDTGELYRRLAATVQTIDKMKHYCGHLYNWYDNHTLEVIGAAYVSTVDSGNFIASLIALKEGLKEYLPEDKRIKDIIDFCRKEIREADFRILYNSKRELFYLGINTESGEHDRALYDLYMSEARTTGYIAVALGEVPLKHWATLGRTLTERGFYLGAVSWSGTAFEYFMPSLFLDVPEDSFSFEALKFAFAEQRRRFVSSGGRKRVFGTSESGFFAFDGDMNYQYRAFGVPTLSLRREDREDYVISPYSSFLMLGIAPQAAAENLERLKTYGMYGKYGFFEAIDFTDDRTGGEAVVTSFMAHHVGMSIVAAVNAAMDNLFVRRFMSDENMGSARELLEERIPVDAVVHKAVDQRIPPKKQELFRDSGSDSVGISVLSPGCHVTVGHESLALTTDSGLNTLSFRDGKRQVLLNRPFMSKTDFYGSVRGLVLSQGKLFSVASALSSDEDTVEFRRTGDYLDYSVRSGRRSVRFRLCPFGAQSAFLLEMTLTGFEGAYSCAAAFDCALCEREEYIAHPAFKSLFLTSEKRENCLVIKRNPRTESDFPAALAVGFANGNTDFECGRSVAEAGGAEALLMSGRELDCKDGSMLAPQVLIRLNGVSRTRRTRVRASFIIAYGRTPDKAQLAFCEACTALSSGNDCSGFGEKLREGILNSAGIDTDNIGVLERFLLARTFFGKAVEGGKRQSVELLWRYGISGDLPIVTFFIGSDCAKGRPERRLYDAVRLAVIHKLHSICRYEYDLVFITDAPYSYCSEVKTGITECLRRAKSEYLLSKRGGVHIIDGADAEALELFRGVSAVFRTSLSRLGSTDSGDDRPEFPRTELSENAGKYYDVSRYKGLIRGEAGSFFDGGYIIDKFAYRPNALQSHILFGGSLGTLVTERGLGFTWVGNASLSRLSVFENDPFSDRRSEKLLLTDGNITFDVLSSLRYTVYSCATAEYFGCVGGTDFRVRVFVLQSNSVKCVEVTMRRSSAEPCRLTYSLTPQARFGENIVFERSNGRICFSAAAGNKYSRSGFIMSPSEKAQARLGLYGGSDDLHTAYVDIGIAGKGETVHLFFIGEKPNGDGLYEKLRDMSENTDKLRADSAEYSRAFLPTLKSPCTEGDTAETACLCRLFDFWLGYQTVFGRLLGRTGLYQPGGAYGFRDQLQDCIIWLYGRNPGLARAHILRAASHQFEQGDCQHWWHEDGEDFAGIRSRCSDDYLWLVYTALEYLDATKDSGILEENVAFLSGEPLKDGEDERYFAARHGNESASLYEHLRRALELLLRRGLGRHLQPYMGSCDWNDGMNLVGRDGGESVWLGFFCRILIHRFGKLARSRGDDCFAAELAEFADRTDDGCERYCYNGRWYARAFFGDGTPLGNDLTLEGGCSIDILPQAFAAFAYCGIPERRTEEKRLRMISALESAYEILFDREKSVVKLFSPPFENPDKNPGYIAGYVPGVRENGGQYTHAAVWLALALLEADEFAPGRDFHGKAREILYAVSPAKKSLSAAEAADYSAEPYVMCGDVGMNGKGGWSWYTGSAMWYYRALIRLWGLDGRLPLDSGQSEQ